MALAGIIIALILAITLHEFAHAWVSNYLGDQTAKREGRLTINPIAHIDPFLTLALPILLIIAQAPVVFGAAKPVPFNPWAVRYGKWGAAMVAVAGPLTNLLIACFFALWLRLFSPAGVGLEMIINIIMVNIGFFVFNMIPFPPLDGSRVLYAAAPLAIREVMDRIERGGLMVLFLFLFVGFPLISPFITRIVGSIMQVLVPGLTSL